MLAVIEVGLVERAPLPFVDRPGIAVAELAEFPGRLIGAGDKRDQPLLSGLAVEGDRDAAVLLDAADRADRTVDDAGPAFVAPCRGAGELDPVVFGEGQGAVGGLQHMIAAKRPLLPARTWRNAALISATSAFV